jgi:cyclohexa-1,5-dienecarbonyl-CoA hydratase
MYKHIVLEKKEGVAKITLNRPPVNILNIEMMREIIDLLGDLKKDKDLKVVLFQGNPKAFSAGVDVGEHTAEKVNEMIDVFGKLFEAINSIPVITLASVEAMALGGGCEVATFCDLIVASENAKFGQPEIKLAVFPPVAAPIFPRLVGRHRALELLLSGDTIGAKEAYEIGLINRLYPTEGYQDSLQKFISRFTAQSAIALALTKKAIDKGLYLPVPEAINVANKIYLEELMKTEDANEGLKSFLEKRKPVWKNR